jgi:thiol-disulfide isomerase/thioredoxin
VKWLWLLVLAATLGLTVFLRHQGSEQSSSDFVFRMPPQPLPTVTVADGDGRKVGVLDDLRGKFVLLNVWATWCVPCRKEMPTLDRLQEQLGGPDFEVVALSVDKGGAEAVRRFYDQIGIRRLSVRVAADPDDLLAALGVYGVPTTLFVDRQSREIGRLVGPANWDSKEMIDFLKLKIAP